MNVNKQWLASELQRSRGITWARNGEAFTETTKFGTREQVRLLITVKFDPKGKLKYQNFICFDFEFLQHLFLIMTFLFAALRNQNYIGLKPAETWGKE